MLISHWPGAHWGFALIGYEVRVLPCIPEMFTLYPYDLPITLTLNLKWGEALL